MTKKKAFQKKADLIQNKNCLHLNKWNLVSQLVKNLVYINKHIICLYILWDSFQNVYQLVMKSLYRDENMKWIKSFTLLWQPQICTSLWRSSPFIYVMIQRIGFIQLQSKVWKKNKQKRKLISDSKHWFTFPWFTNYKCAPHLHAPTFLPTLPSNSNLHDSTYAVQPLTLSGGGMDDCLLTTTSLPGPTVISQG